MPFHFPFNFPYIFGPNYKNIHTTNNISNSKYNNFIEKKEDLTEKAKTFTDESSDYFFEILGLKLYLDDIIIISLLFFLYTENVQDQELFVCLILLLLS